MIPQIRSTLKRIIRSVLTTATRNYIYTVKYGGVKIQRQGDLGFLKLRAQVTAEEQFLSNLNLNGKTIYDVGSNVGILTIFFAKSVGQTGQVIAFEPNRQIFMRLRQNVELNNLDNVEILNIGIGDKQEVGTFFVPRYTSGMGSFIKNMNVDVRKIEGFKSLPIEIDTLDHYIEVNKLPKPDMIKIDVEGMEYNVLQGATETITRYKPNLHIELHTTEETMGNIHRIVDFLNLHRYSVYHVDLEQWVTANNTELVSAGHIFCRSIVEECSPTLSSDPKNQRLSAS